MKTIAVDMDGVLADVFEQFVRYDAARTGIRKSPKDVFGKGEVELFPHANTDLLTSGFFRNMSVIKDSQEVLERLNREYQVFIVSSATQFPQSLTEKQDWLKEHFPFIGWQQIVFCGKKTIIHADVMIDDHFKNLDPFQGKTFLFSQPHNAHLDDGRHTRVHSWKDIDKILKRQ